MQWVDRPRNSVRMHPPNALALLNRVTKPESDKSVPEINISSLVLMYQKYQSLSRLIGLEAN